ncbi:hypothetical protein TruAng_010154 [Truncatella angustata]|nr:hypothetical protein TruAng_010154 [Truncatella angustata]
MENVAPTYDLVNKDILELCHMEGIEPPTDQDYVAETPEDETLTSSELKVMFSVIDQRNALRPQVNPTIPPVRPRKPLPSLPTVSGVIGQAQVYSQTTVFVASPAFASSLATTAATASGGRAAATLIYSCNECSKTFSNVMKFKQHLLEVHVGTKCHWAGCRFEAVDERDLDRHLIKHNKPSIKHVVDGAEKVQCLWPGCGQLYTTTGSLNRHTRRHQVKACVKAELEEDGE